MCTKICVAILLLNNVDHIFQVKELQRVSGAIVKTPDTKNFPEVEEVPVTIIGHFYASQLAQRRIRALMSQSQGPPRGRGGPGPQQNGM